MNFIWYRMVGGFVGLGPNHTFECRARFALGVGAYMAFLAAVKQRPYLDIAAVFIICTLTSFLGRLIPHARFQATASLGNSLGMAAVGIARLALIIAPYVLTINFEDWQHITPMMITLDPWAAGVSLLGALQGVAYYFGNKNLDGADSGIYWRNKHSQYRIHQGVILPDENPDDFLDQAAVGGSEWGELLSGIFVYDLPYKILLLLP